MLPRKLEEQFFLFRGRDRQYFELTHVFVGQVSNLSSFCRTGL
jgi:hypothetical protein